MSEREGASNTEYNGGNVRRLSDAVQRLRLQEAERADALADLSDAERVRLEMLFNRLASVFADLPEDDDYFICHLAGGAQPRLWIDPTSHVVIKRDRRTYSLVKETRFGRTILGETADMAAMSDLITNYVATRIIDRERMRESDYLLARLGTAALSPLPQEKGPEQADPARKGARAPLLMATFFFLGLLLGIGGVLLYMSLAVTPLILE